MIEKTNSRRLAKNTLLMYLRMFFLMVISLYTSRVILQQLGVVDYGIYNLVASVVTMFISLKSIFAASTQRFLNVEMGKGNHDKLLLIYNLSTYINLIISIIFFIISEIVGLWFLESKANIPPDRLLAAHIVLQCSIATIVVSIMNTPLDACVIAHERMDFYAYLSIFEGLAKLGICYMLSIALIDKLILYAILTLLISLIVRVINRIFCSKHFSECRLVKVWDGFYFKQMISYASWAFFGNTAYAFAQSGLNMVLNIFGGPIVNAARGLSYQVNTALWSCTSNISIVLKPYTIKNYSQGNKAMSFNIAFLSSKIYFFINLIITISFAYLSEYLINIWLGQIPEYLIVFLNLILIQSLIKSLQMPLDMLFSAEGNIKLYQLFEGIILFLPVPVSYILLKMGLPYYSVFLSAIFFEILHILGIACIGKIVFGLNLGLYIKRVIIPTALLGTICLVLYFISYKYLISVSNNILAMFITIVISIFFMAIYVLDKTEKQLLISIIKNHK